MDLKYIIVDNAKAVIKGLTDGTIRPSQTFQIYPRVCLLSGLADASYYTEATHASHAPQGVYPLKTPDDDLTGQPDHDRLDTPDIIATVRQLLVQMNGLDSSDVKDMLDASTDLVAGTTSSQWTADHLYPHLRKATADHADGLPF